MHQCWQSDAWRTTTQLRSLDSNCLEVSCRLWQSSLFRIGRNRSWTQNFKVTVCLTATSLKELLSTGQWVSYSQASIMIGIPIPSERPSPMDDPIWFKTSVSVGQRDPPTDAKNDLVSCKVKSASACSTGILKKTAQRHKFMIIAYQSHFWCRRCKNTTVGSSSHFADGKPCCLFSVVRIWMFA